MIKIFYNRWMAKKTIERPQGGIQLNNKEDKSLINATPCMNLRVLCWVKKIQSRKVIYSDSIYTTLLNLKNYKDIEQMGDFQGLGWW